VSTDARSGTKCVRETYRFGGYAKVSATGQSVNIGAKNCGGTAVSTAIGTAGYANGLVTFTTGANNTTATVIFISL